MELLLLLILVVALLVGAGFFLGVLVPGIGKGADASPYVRADFLTAAERSFFGVLEQVVADRARIFCKVRLGDIVNVMPGLAPGARQSALNRIQSKHVDFVLCSPETVGVMCVVELDDKSHAAPRRRDRDAFVDQVLLGAGIPIIHVPCLRGYSVDAVRNALEVGHWQ